MNECLCLFYPQAGPEQFVLLIILDTGLAAIKVLTLVFRPLVESLEEERYNLLFGKPGVVCIMSFM